MATNTLAARASSGTDSHTSSGSSVSAIVSTLIPVLLISALIFLVFLLLRKRYPRVYEPRSYLGSLRNWQKSPKQSTGLLGWRKEFSALKDEFVMGHTSIDNYLWLRFFKMLTLMCFVGCIITWPILFPVNATGTAPDITGLDILSFSHIEPGPRYYAQVFVCWIFLSWVMFMITRESKFFVRLRQQYFLSPYESSRISRRTVLFVNVPEEARNEEYLRREFSLVKAVWLVNVPKELADNVTERDKAAAKLESGEVNLIKNYLKRDIKAQKKAQKKGEVAETRTGDGITFNKKDRPTHRLYLTKLKLLPLGKKVDTVDWSRGELRRLVPEVFQEQTKLRDQPTPPEAACFIEFETVEAAHTAMLSLNLKKKVKMTAKEQGTAPQDVIWKNTLKSAKTVSIFSALCTAFVWWLCIFWTIPVAVIGAISNINYLTDEVHFLSFINDIPSVILGVVTGLLPVILLSVLMSLVPIVCAILAKLFEPTQSAVQMKVQGWYFPFQVIQVFLVTTFASGASSVVTSIIKDPSTATSLLATNLPKASNFYISYFILFGLNTAAMQFLNVVPLLFVLFLGKLLDKTPRKMYNRYVNLGGLGWGSLYPKFTNLGVIALAYSSIAPLILGFATIGFWLLYLAYKYNALFTLGTTVSTRGESFARALKQLITGIYISEICMIGLFAIGVGTTTQSIGPLVLMFVFLLATIAWHVWLGRSLRKLDQSVPEALLVDDHQRVGEAEKGFGSTDSEQSPQAEKSRMSAAPNGTGRGGLMARIKGYFAPTAAADQVIWSMSPQLSTPPRPYTQREHDEAYLHPAITSECPQVWIAQDKFGLSTKEIADSRNQVGEGFEMTDSGATYNEKAKVEFNHDDLTAAPIWRDEPVY